MKFIPITVVEIRLPASFPQHEMLFSERMGAPLSMLCLLSMCPIIIPLLCFGIGLGSVRIMHIAAKFHPELEILSTVWLLIS